MNECGVEIHKSSEMLDETSHLEALPPGLSMNNLMLMPEVIISTSSYEGKKPLSLSIVNDVPYFYFSCSLRGKIHSSAGSQQISLQSGNLLKNYSPGYDFSLVMMPDYRNVSLVMPLERLFSLIGNDHDYIKQQVRRGYWFQKIESNNRTYHAALRLAQLMDRRSQRLLIHAAALEFLAWHVGAEVSPSNHHTISTREQKQLLAARDQLLQDLSNPPTIAELSRDIGLNQLKLKRGFKAMFGESIYALFQRERMMHARSLLLEHKVTETAVMLGYSNVSHFSVAFRKQFGVLPRDARKGF